MSKKPGKRPSPKKLGKKDMKKAKGGFFAYSPPLSSSLNLNPAAPLSGDVNGDMPSKG